MVMGATCYYEATGKGFEVTSSNVLITSHWLKTISQPQMLKDNLRNAVVLQ